MTVNFYLLPRRSPPFFLLVGVCILQILGAPQLGWTQAQSTVEIFREDLEDSINQTTKEKKKVLGSYVKPRSTDLKVRGDCVEFSQDGQKLILKDRVVASSEKFSIQADKGEVTVENQEGEFSGEVFLSHPDFAISCKEAYLNIPHEVGVFRDAKLRIEEAEFNAKADSLIKYSELQYRMYDSSVSTCDPDVLPSPWSISSDELDITEDGYAHAYWTSLSFYDVPILYSPYLGFPVGQEKSSGFLVPSIGYSNQSGAQVWLPYHIVLDDATDLTITPFIETQTRQGGEFEFRKAFSLSHNIKSRWIFSDESLRDGDLRGLLPRPDNVLPYEERRTGGFYRQEWRSDAEADVPMSVLADVHYVNDDLLLRELEDNDIGFRNSPFLTSRVLGTTSLGSYGSAELFGEWNQAIDSNFQETDDAILQRLPEANVRLSEKWRPFGFNPYGLQLTTNANVSFTDFYRGAGVDGQRVNINPEISVPFHIENYIQGGFGLSYYDTRYMLGGTENTLAPDGTAFSDSPSRQTYVAGANVSTVLESVYEVAPDSLLTTIAGLGVENYENELKKVKHELEPFLRYSFSPDEYQDDLPLFDSLDRIRNQSLITYGFTNRFLGKTESIRSYRSPIEELTPQVEDLPELGLADSLVNLEFPRESFSFTQNSFGRAAESRSMGYFTVLQSYDLIEASEDIDPLRSEFSDVYLDFGLNPNSVFGFNTTANYNVENASISSWTTGLSVRDDRGDSVSVRYSLVSPQVLVDNQVTDGIDISNIDAQLEMVLTDQVKLGYYARYDETARSFIDQIVGLRMANGCNCWSVDLGFSDRTNPDRQQLLMRVNLNGLGRLQQGILYNSIRESLR
jgi:lipopolysaccharide assembly outer membrane protein LptD (OstA)